MLFHHRFYISKQNLLQSERMAELFIEVCFIIADKADMCCMSLC